MSARTERREAAAARRREWKLLWLETVQNTIKSGGTMKQGLEEVSRMVASKSFAPPQHQSEVTRAVAEFCSAISATAREGV